MNSKTTILIIAGILLIAAAAITQNYLNKSQKEGTPLDLEGEGEWGAEKQEEPAVSGETVLQKQGFEITLPAGWQEEENSPYANILLMVVDAGEEIVDQELGFRTNLTVKKDDQGSYDKVYQVREYVDSVKESLVQAVPGIEFTHEEEKTVNGNDALFLECESSQAEGDFTTLLVFIEDADNAVWALSFNTYQSSWPVYHALFYQMAESFKTENAS